MKKIKFPNIEFFIGLPFFFLFIYFLSVNNKFKKVNIGQKYSGKVTDLSIGNGSVGICYDTTCFDISSVYNDEYSDEYRSLGESIAIGDSILFFPGVNDTFYLFKGNQIYKYFSPIKN